MAFQSALFIKPPRAIFTIGIFNFTTTLHFFLVENFERESEIEMSNIVGALSQLRKQPVLVPVTHFSLNPLTVKYCHEMWKIYSFQSLLQQTLLLLQETTFFNFDLSVPSMVIKRTKGFSMSVEDNLDWKPLGLQRSKRITLWCKRMCGLNCAVYVNETHRVTIA